VKAETVQVLNNVNKKFYDIVGPFFDSSRQYAWDGWERIAEEFRIQNSEKRKVLDVGCGNGRFETFLRERGAGGFEYTGIDSNEYLLSQFKPMGTSSEVHSIDILGEWSIDTKYDLIVSFGVMHHIPSFSKRDEFVQKCADLLEENGILCLSFWNFLDDERIAKKQANWGEAGLTSDDVEENDYLLTWERGAHAVRYCHYHTDKEIDELVKTSNLKKIARYKAEGKNGNLNTYCIVKKA
jgi:tRNA (uracil-5-)-methyltransferase TRM9